MLKKIKYPATAFALAAIVLITNVNCSNTKSETAKVSTTDSLQKDTTAKVDVVLKDTLEQGIYNSYIILKDALVKSDAVKAKMAAADLALKLGSDKAQTNALASAKKIAGTADLAAQRKDFTSLSNDVIALFKKTSIAAGNIYVQHCPMANKGEGGDWLSSEKKIQNPYYGDEMLECGAILETLPQTK